MTTHNGPEYLRRQTAIKSRYYNAVIAVAKALSQADREEALRLVNDLMFGWVEAGVPLFSAADVSLVGRELLNRRELAATGVSLNG